MNNTENVIIEDAEFEEIRDDFENEEQVEETPKKKGIFKMIAKGVGIVTGVSLIFVGGKMLYDYIDYKCDLSGKRAIRKVASSGKDLERKAKLKERFEKTPDEVFDEDDVEVVDDIEE